MIAALLLLLDTAQLVTGKSGMTIDWSSLPMLPYREEPVLPPQMTSYVAREAALRNCRVATDAQGRKRMQTDVAVLLGEDGGVRVSIPRAIDCPTVEQFAAGFVESSARGNVRARTLRSGGGWYRATLVFEWD